MKIYLSIAMLSVVVSIASLLLPAFLLMTPQSVSKIVLSEERNRLLADLLRDSAELSKKIETGNPKVPRNDKQMITQWPLNTEKYQSEVKSLTKRIHNLSSSLKERDKQLSEALAALNRSNDSGINLVTVVSLVIAFLAILPPWFNLFRK